MAEQFGFDQVFGNGRAVELNKRKIRAGAILMNPTGVSGFARTGWSVNQEGRKVDRETPVCLENLFQLAQILCKRTFEEKVLAFPLVAFLFVLADPGIFSSLVGVREHEGQFVEVKGFGGNRPLRVGVLPPPIELRLHPSGGRSGWNRGPMFGGEGPSFRHRAGSGLRGRPRKTGR